MIFFLFRFWLLNRLHTGAISNSLRTFFFFRLQTRSEQIKTSKMYLDGTNGIRPIGDGLLEVTEASLNNLIVQGDINDIYDVEHTPFARYFVEQFSFSHLFLNLSFAVEETRRGIYLPINQQAKQHFEIQF